MPPVRSCWKSESQRGRRGWAPERSKGHSPYALTVLPGPAGTQVVFTARRGTKTVANPRALPLPHLPPCARVHMRTRAHLPRSGPAAALLHFPGAMLTQTRRASAKLRCGRRAFARGDGRTDAMSAIADCGLASVPAQARPPKAHRGRCCTSLCVNVPVPYPWHAERRAQIARLSYEGGAARHGCLTRCARVAPAAPYSEALLPPPRSPEPEARPARAPAATAASAASLCRRFSRLLSPLIDAYDTRGGWDAGRFVAVVRHERRRRGARGPMRGQHGWASCSLAGRG